MKPKTGLVGVFAMAAALSLAPLAFAQEGGAGQEPSAGPSSSDHYSGADSVKDSAKHMATAAESDARSAYHAVKRTTKNAAITTEAKAALLKDPATRHSTIHVRTKRGVVTLSGKVDSSDVAQHAQEVVARLDGVRAVRNKLEYPAAGESDSPAPEQAPPATQPGAPAEAMPQPER